MDPKELYRQLEAYEVRRNADEEGRMIELALQQAITETIQRIAATIINERRAEIEAACNFGELRDVLAAELARQFMASRLTGAPTPFNAAKVSPAATSMLRAASRAGQGTASTTQQGYGPGIGLGILGIKGTP